MAVDRSNAAFFVKKDTSMIPFRKWLKARDFNIYNSGGKDERGNEMIMLGYGSPGMSLQNRGLIIIVNNDLRHDVIRLVEAKISRGN